MSGLAAVEREAKPDMVGVAIFDRHDKILQEHADLVELAWSKREIENYFCTREVLLRYAEQPSSSPCPPLLHRR